MKKFSYFILLVFVFTAVSCIPEMEMDPTATTGYELLIQTRVDGMATKADVPDVPELKEDDIQTLDVYISGTFKGDAAPSVKHFSLNAGTNLVSTSGGSQTWRVSPDWRTDHFVVGNTYTVYVAANSSKVKTSVDSGDPTVATTTLSDMNITTLASLKNAIEFDYNPAEDNGKGGKYPFWGNQTSGGVNPALLGVHKLFTSGSISSAGDDAGRSFTEDKRFLMNGTASFTATLDSDGRNILVTDAVTLTRAAAKIAVSIRFNPTYLSTKHWTPCGQPKWRFCNFAFNTPIFSDLTPDPAPAVSRFTTEGEAGMPLYASLSAGSEYSTDSDKHFSFATYSYPFSWTAETADSNAPAIIVSVCYRDDSDLSVAEASRPVKWQDYKIPVVNPEAGIFSLDRNKMYTIDATITDGTLDPDPYDLKAAYIILAWDSSDSMPVNKRDNSYIDVIPDAIAEHSGTQKVTDVILRGNGQQSFRLEILKPKTKSFAIAFFGISGASQSNPFGQTATPTDYPLTGTYTGKKGNVYNHAATGAQVPYYINLNGDIRNTIGNSSTPADNYIQNCFVKEDDEHLLIISDALPNKGVKFMKIRVYLESDPSIYMDVNIRHYPTDAIMAKVGHWASRQSAAYTAGIIQESDRIAGPEELFFDMNTHKGSQTYGGDEISYDPDVYDSWKGFKYYVWETCNETDTGVKELRHNFEITQDVYKSHTDDGTVDGTADAGFEKHIDTNSYTLYFIENEGVKNGVGAGSLSECEDLANRKSESSAFLTKNKEDHKWYYWGDATQGFYRVSDKLSLQDALTEGYNVDYIVEEDITTGGLFPRTDTHYYGYRFNVKHRVYYTGEQWVRKKFYHVKSNFRTWPDWSLDIGKTFYVGMYQLSGGRTFNYPARIAESNTEWYHFAGNTSGDSATLAKTAIAAKNRQMYILQLSETSADYTIGRPLMNESYMSDDEVVSPAFMIASQLGFLNTDMVPLKQPDGKPDLSSSKYAKYWAAAHCASYLEVDTNGDYYYGWRLPTRREIEVMMQYQGDGTSANLVSGFPVSNDDRVMKPVLEAGYYFALNGELVDNTAYSNGANNEVTVRCVRDLTPQEIEALDK